MIILLWFSEKTTLGERHVNLISLLVKQISESCRGEPSPERSPTVITNCLLKAEMVTHRVHMSPGLLCRVKEHSFEKLVLLLLCQKEGFLTEGFDRRDKRPG